MEFRNHFVAGIVTSSLASIAWKAIHVKAGIELNDPNELLIIFGLCLAGSLIPDLDTQSKPSKIFAFLGSIFCIVSLIVQEPYPALMYSAAFLFIKSFNHRTWTHVWALPVVLVFVGIYFDQWMLIPFAVGIVCHYILDCFGPQKMLPWRVNSWVKPLRLL